MLKQSHLKNNFVTKLTHILQEIIKADKRCTNLVLESFGICVPTAVMTSESLVKHLRSKYGDKTVIYYHMQTEWEYQRYMQKWPDFADKKKLSSPYLTPFYGNPAFKFEPLGWGIPQPTVRNLAKFLKDNNGYGHYVVVVPSHVLAIHYTSKHGMIAVDSEEKFLSSRRVQGLYIIRPDAKVNHAFSSFMETTERTDSIKKY